MAQQTADRSNKKQQQQYKRTYSAVNLIIIMDYFTLHRRRCRHRLQFFRSM